MTTSRIGKSKDQPVDTGHEAEYWRMADALRGSMDAAEYNHVVLGLIFLKYISDAFEERHAEVLAGWGREAAEGRDEYIAENIFWVPLEARWPRLQSQAHQPTIGRMVDDAMIAIERDNPALKDVLPKDYARPALDKSRLGHVVDMVSNIKVGGAEAHATDVLGFGKSPSLEEIRKHGHVLTPGRYVGAAPQEDDGVPFQEKMAHLATQWREQQTEGQRLEPEIEANLARLAFGVNREGRR